MNMRTRPGRGVLALLLSLLLAGSLVPAAPLSAFAEGADGAAAASASGDAPPDAAGEGDVAGEAPAAPEPPDAPVPDGGGDGTAAAASPAAPEAAAPAASDEPGPAGSPPAEAEGRAGAASPSAAMAPASSHDGSIEVGDLSYHFIEKYFNVPVSITVEEPADSVTVMLSWNPTAFRHTGIAGWISESLTTTWSINQVQGTLRVDMRKKADGAEPIDTGTYTFDLRLENNVQDEAAKGIYPVTVNPASYIDGAVDPYLKDGSVTIGDEPSELYSITIAEGIEHGSVQVNTYFGDNKAYRYEPVEVVFVPDEGYRLRPDVYHTYMELPDGRSVSFSSSSFDVASNRATLQPTVPLTIHATFELAELPMDFEGEGTEEEPWLIGDLDDFRLFAEQVNRGEAFSGSYFELTSDLVLPTIDAGQDLLDIPWQSPGTPRVGTRTDAPFSGTFSGGGHSVTLDIDRTAHKQLGEQWPQSLFGLLDGATVEDLVVRGSVQAYGSAASFAQSIRNGTVIRRCANFADVYAAHDNAGGIVGNSGIGGGARNLIAETANYGDVTAARTKAGGFVGTGSGGVKLVDGVYVSSGYLSITDCFNLGAVSAAPSETAVGAFGGYDVSPAVSNSYHAGSARHFGANGSALVNSYCLEGALRNLASTFEVLTAEQLRSAAQVLDNDRGVWADDYEGEDSVAKGFPRLAWQAPGTGVPYDPADDGPKARPVEDIAVTAAGGGPAVIDGPGGSLQLAATVLPADADDPSCSWSVAAGAERASVSAEGLLAALPGATDGTVIVRASASDGSGVFGALVVLLRGQGGASGEGANVTVGQTGGAAAGAVRLGAPDAEPGAGAGAGPGEEVRVYAAPASTHYTAQVRYSVDGGASYTALAQGADGSWRLTVPAAEGGDAPAVDVRADFVPIVWDGTMDVTWYDPAASVYTLSYAAQFAGAAAINNGIFTTYPVSPGTTTEGTPADLPDYGAYLAGMGVRLAEGADPFDTRPGAPSRLYGEFSSTYRLSDSQARYARTGSILATARVVGEPAYVVARRGNGATGANNMVSTNDWYNGDESFKGKTVLIAADLDFGGRRTGGAWDVSSPLFMSLGGEYAMLPGQGARTNSYAKIGSSFCGTLDGLGHSLRNVYAERYANTAYGDSTSLGVVGRLGVHDGDPYALRPTDPTVRRVVLESGLVSARRSVGGIVGKIGRTTASKFSAEGWPGQGDGSTGGIVEYCVNKAVVRNTDAKGCGGIVGASWNGGLVQYCANLGSVTSTFICPTGGIVGSNEDIVRNCYSVGAVKASSSSFSMGIGTNNGGGDKVSDCWWLAGTAPGGGYFDGKADDAARYPSVRRFGGEGDAEQTLTAALLNAGSGSASGPWADDPAPDGSGVNALGGVSYPVLYFQSGGAGGEGAHSVAVARPEHGTVSASATGGRMGESVRLSVVADPGWALDHFTVDGGGGSGPAPITGDSFPLFSDVTVSAVMRELVGVPLVLEPAPAPGGWEVSVVKVGTVAVEGGGYALTDGPVPVLAGGLVFEGDVLTLSGTLAEGASPGGEGKAYTGEFSYEVLFGATKVSVTLGMAEKSVVATRERMEAASAASAAEGGSGGSGGGSASVTVRAVPEVGGLTWGPLADVSWYEGHEGDASYTLSTAAQLAGLAKLVNSGVQSFEGRTLVLSAPSGGGAVSLAAPGGGTLLWVPIGTAAQHFKGTLEGDGGDGGVTVSGLAVERSSLYSALIGYAEGATVRGLTVSGTVSGTQYVAGVVARMDGGLVEGCTSSVTVAATGSRAGGVAGYASAGAVVRGCTNSGVVLGASDVGGIAGALSGASVEGCANSGAVTATAPNAAAGVGGIAGSVRREASASASVSSSRNSGAVAVASASGTSAGPAGGVAGHASGASLLQCASVGAVSAEAGPAGGLVGSASSAEVASCYAHGAVSSCAGLAGGLAGMLAGASKLSSSYAAASVSSGAGAGSFGSVAGSLAAAATYSSVYFLSAAGVPPATGAGGTGAGHTASALSSSALMAAWGPGGLGDAFRRSRGGANGGYPVLAWELADASALDASIAAAVLARGPVRTSADGRDVPDGLRWAPVAACTALDAAVASAVAASEDLALSADALAARASTLDAALSAFQTQVKTAAVSRTALSAKASSLRSLLASTAASANGRDVAQGKAWATPAVRTALAAALAKAQAALSDVAATQAGTDAALSALSTAERAFKAKVGKGTKAASHTVRLDANGGKLAAKAASLKKAHGAAVGNITAKPTRTGYTFQGWFTAKSSSGKKVSAKAKVTKDVTYWAHWKANGPVVTLNANGGKVGKAASASVVRTKGKALGKLAAPTRAGYTFLGWYTGKVKGTKVTTRTKVTRSVTLYAHWKAKTYTVKLNANGGKLGKASTTSLKKTHNAKFGKLATPKRTGYTFQGWYTGKVKGTKVTASTKVTRAVTLYAHWKRTAG